MASRIYAKGLANLLASSGHLEQAGMSVVLVKGTYAFNAAHEFYSDIAASVVDGTAAIALTNPAVTESASVIKFDSDDTGLTWYAVNDPDAVGAAVVFLNTGAPATSPLISFMDDPDLITHSADVIVTWATTGIFTLDLT